MTDEVSVYLRVVKLYTALLAYVDEVAESGDLNPDEVRRHPDRILSQGKIMGRRTAYSDGFAFCETAGDDRLIEDWQRIVDSNPRGG